jgi:ADP-ribose pyrophosphatase YjhB (NUDIX family)/predicted DNA-binding WGR domain protein
VERKQIVVVLGCVVDESRVLLTQRSEPDLPAADRRWDLPGGKPEFGELTTDTVTREVFEETGLEVEPVEVVPYVHTNLWRYQDQWLHVILICYLCRPTRDARRTKRQASEVRQVRWMDLREVDMRRALPGIREFLGWVAKNRLGIQVTEVGHHRSVYLECVKPELNVSKFYFVSDCPPTLNMNDRQLMLFEKGVPDEPLVVTRSWGRRGSSPRSLVEEYYSEQTVVRRIAEVLRERQAMGYVIVDSSMGQTFDDVYHTLMGQVNGAAQTLQ